MEVGIVVDERIAEGHYYGRCFREIVKYIKDPSLLEEKPTLRNQDDALVDILCEEAAPYFAGDVDEKTAAKTMQARTKLLLLEQAG